MAVANFEDHCWKDIVTPEILKTYTPYHRETFIGQRPALLAIDLYNLAYEGGPKEPHELVDTHKSSCGVYAYNAIKPTQELFALARSLKIPVFYTTTETRKEAKPDAVYATNRQRVKIDPQAFEIREEFKPEQGDVVIFKTPGEKIDWVKRVIGLPGDTVAVDNGRLVINGRPVSRSNAGTVGVTISPNSPCRVASGAEPVIVREAAETLCLYPLYREQLPNGFQRSEYLHDHGMVDMVLHRHELRDALARLCSLMIHRQVPQEVAVSEHKPHPTIMLDGKGIAGAVHTPAPVAPADDCDELACRLIVVSCDELGQRLLRGATAKRRLKSSMNSGR